MKPVLLRVATLIGVVTVLVALAGSAPTWKRFSSHGGWDMRYPSGWRITSCRSCTDPKAAGVFVTFFPPSGHGGSVMVEPLADKPSPKNVDQWLSEVAKTNNLNRHGREEKMILNGLAALRVRYRTAEQGEMEQVYVASGAKTFSITFSEDESSTHSPIEKLGNYSLYSEMLASFRARQR